VAFLGLAPAFAEHDAVAVAVEGRTAFSGNCCVVASGWVTAAQN
jgi:hypothetical protein